MSWRSVAICERCWMDEQGTWDPLRLEKDDHGSTNLIAQLIDCPRPVLIQSEHTGLERCYSCGRPTIWGCYVRRNVS